MCLERTSFTPTDLPLFFLTSEARRWVHSQNKGSRTRQLSLGPQFGNGRNPGPLPIVKHLEKICSVCGGHLISMNIPPKNWEGCYASSSRVGGKLCLLVGVRTIPLLKSWHNTPRTHTLHDLSRFGS
jgi:hypothetical protein